MNLSKKDIKVLLIQPPYLIWPGEPQVVQPPIGLAYLAAVLEKEGITTKILDALVEGYSQKEPTADGQLLWGLNFDQILDEIKQYQPHIIGITCSFSTVAATVQALSQKIKAMASKIKIVVGGAHPTALPEATLNENNIDFVISGEGEYRLKNLITSLITDQNFDHIDGLAYKKNDLIIINTSKNYIQNLDELPYPAWHRLPMEKYFAINKPQGTLTKGKRVIPIITSRGCPANCIFCAIHGIWGKQFRAHTPEYVVNHMIHLINHYHIDEVVFEDDNLTFDLKRAEKIFDLMIEKKLNLKWKTPNGIAIWRMTEPLIRAC